MRRRGTFRLAGSTVVAFLVCVASLAGVASAQPYPVQYAYDELGRLVAVVDQDGNAALYAYDAVGNILSIQRVDAATLPDRVAITAVVPRQGKGGIVVSILGKGFGVNPGDNAVAFNGVAAPVAHAAPTRIVTAVPPGATTGRITVTTPLGSAISPEPFAVVGAIALAPASVSLGIGATQQFVASDDGGATTNVLWAVNDVVGGDPGVGTITGQGLYTAPTAIAAVRTVTVTATSRDDVAIVAAATVTLRPPLPLFLAAPAVGVHVVVPEPRPLVAPAIGAHRASDHDGLTIVASAIGVTRPAVDAFSGVFAVSVSVAPSITAVSPAAASRGSIDLTLIMTGTGLDGMVALDVLLNHAPDAAITVSELVATSEGTEVTARISIAATATVGPRVLRLRAASGATTSVGAGGNVFTVQ
jgi:YD repeat-containing protein